MQCNYKFFLSKYVPLYTERKGEEDKFMEFLILSLKYCRELGSSAVAYLGGVIVGNVIINIFLSKYIPLYTGRKGEEDQFMESLNLSLKYCRELGVKLLHIMRSEH